MIIEQYGKKQHSIALNEWYIKVGFISGVFLLLILLSATNPSSDHTMAAFAQEQNNNTNSTSTTSPELNSTQADFVSNMEQISGHLNAEVMNKEAGNNTLAKAHTLHPIAEIYSSIEPQISNTNATLNGTLSTNLNQLSQIVNTSSAEEFESQSKKISGLEPNCAAGYS
ncbi:hypothetical protein BH18THE2_BH18THE2_38670 [soil metagenome]